MRNPIKKQKEDYFIPDEEYDKADWSFLELAPLNWFNIQYWIDKEEIESRSCIFSKSSQSDK